MKFIANKMQLLFSLTLSCFAARGLLELYDQELKEASGGEGWLIWLFQNLNSFLRPARPSLLSHSRPEFPLITEIFARLTFPLASLLPRH